MGLDRRPHSRRPGRTTQPKENSPSVAQSPRVGRPGIKLEPRHRITLDPSKRRKIVIRLGERPRLGIARDQREGREGRLRLVRLPVRRKPR